MEKQAVIRPGLTPAEKGSSNEKKANLADLEKHATKRLSDRVSETVKADKKSS